MAAIFDHPINDFLAIAGCFPGVGTIIGSCELAATGGTLATYPCTTRAPRTEFSTMRVEELIQKRKELMNFKVTLKRDEDSEKKLNEFQAEITEIKVLKDRVRKNITDSKSFFEKRKKKEITGLESIKNVSAHGSLTVLKNDIIKAENENRRIKREFYKKVESFSSEVTKELDPKMKESISKFETLISILDEREKILEEKCKTNETAKSDKVQLVIKVRQFIQNLDMELKRKKDQRALKYHAAFGAARLTWIGGVIVCIYYFHHKHKQLKLSEPVKILTDQEMKSIGEELKKFGVTETVKEKKREEI